LMCGAWAKERRRINDMSRRAAKSPKHRTEALNINTHHD